jgi:hypothetical protein
VTVDTVLADGEYVTALWTFRGTHTGAPFGGLPPTGARLEMGGMTLWRIVDGRISEEWTEFDEHGAYAMVLSQLKGALVALALAAVALIILVERLSWAVIRRLVRRRPVPQSP